MDNVLIEPFKSPTGFGLAQTQYGIYPLSPCCGKNLRYKSQCAGCITSYLDWADKHEASVDLLIQPDYFYRYRHIYALWITRLTGYTEVEIDIER